jgi:hypothetical protein
MFFSKHCYRREADLSYIVTYVRRMNNRRLHLRLGLYMWIVLLTSRTDREGMIFEAVN